MRAFSEAFGSYCLLWKEDRYNIATAQRNRYADWGSFKA
jgi:hypothetical protein